MKLFLMDDELLNDRVCFVVILCALSVVWLIEIIEGNKKMLVVINFMNVEKVHGFGFLAVSCCSFSFFF